MPRGGIQPLGNFETELLLPEGFTARVEDPDDEHEPEASAAIQWLKDSRPAQQNFWPALCLSFVAQIDVALGLLGLDRDPDLLTDARVMRVRANGSQIRQLQLDAGLAGSVMNRRYYDAAAKVIRVEMMRAHPSMPGHATSAWISYAPFIRMVALSSPAGRARIADWIWRLGVLPLVQTITTSARTRRPRLFYEVVKALDTASGSTGGAMYQAMVYAYLAADSPTLTVQSHKVNVGSSRAGALGDVDGFLGEEIVLAAEAKDKHLTMADEDDLMAFLEDVAPFPDADAVVFATAFDDELREMLEDRGLRTMSRIEMLASVALWDVPKQENAVRAMRFFLGQIQKSPVLLAKLVAFVDGVLTDAASAAEAIALATDVATEASVEGTVLA